METTKFHFKSLYLRYAGLLSFTLGLLSIGAFIFGWLQSVADKGLNLAIFGIVGTIVSSAIARDILDRVRNHEPGENSIPIIEQKFAWIGTRIGFALLAILVIIMSIILLGAYVIGPDPVRLSYL